MRWLAIGLGLIVIVAAGTAAIGWYWLSGSLPVLDGTVETRALAAPVQVLRDRHGVPHIRASSERDAYYAIGFAHAQDRLWQMETARRAAAGRLSELFGERTIETDKYMRTLGLAQVAAANLEALSQRSRDLLEAYAAGVNGFLDSHIGPLPPEFQLFGHYPEPWRPVDSLLVGKAMALRLGGNAREELLRQDLSARLEADEVDALWGLAPGTRDRFRHARVDIDSAIVAAGLDLLPPAPPTGIGSNNWVVAGSRTASGKPLLANDIHLGLSAPSPWYLAHLSAPGLNVAGATLPGVPTVISGRNEHVSWGVTNTGPDVQDVFIEKRDRSDSRRYLTPDGTEPMTVRSELIVIADGADITLDVVETRHGPVISEVVDQGVPEDPELFLSLAWTVLAPDDRTLEASFRLARAASLGDALSALEDFHSPQLNFVIADRFGDIGFVAAGRVPVRASGDGWMPSPGWTGDHDWTGYIPYQALPRQINPANGAIATANNNIASATYPYFLGYDWAAPYRWQRISHVLGALESFSSDDFKALQTDIQSDMARAFLPLMIDVELFGASRRYAAWLADWDGVMDRDSGRPLLFWVWYRALVQRVIQDDIGPHFREMWSYWPGFMYRALTEDQSWCDDRTVPRNQTCDVQIATALESAIGWLNENYGEDLEDWAWRDAHYAHHRNRVLGAIPLVGEFADIRVAHDGGPFTVMQASSRLGDEEAPFAEIHGATVRMIGDLDAPDQTAFMISTGQSGNILSPHYDDLAEPWARGDYITVPLTEAGVDGIVAHRLELRPSVDR